MSERPSRLELARLVSGELAEDRARRVRAAVQGDPDLQRELDELSANAAAYEERGAQQRARLLVRLEQETSATGSPRRWWWALAPAAAAALAALVVLVVLPTVRPPAPVPVVAFKGQLAVRVVARRGGRQFVVGQGAALSAGDALRFVVTTGAPGHLVVLSIDGQGTLSPFYPETPAARDPRPLRLESAGRHELPGSVVLDEAPGPELLVVVFSRRPFDRRSVERRLAELARAGTAPDAARVGVQGEVWSLRAPKRGVTP